MALLRLNNKINVFQQQIRAIATTSRLAVKEIKEVKNGKVLEISAEYKPSPRESNLLSEVKNPSTKKFCPKCTLGLDIKHTDVLILSQYCRSDGTMLPRRITKLCATQQKNIGTMVLMARRAGLLALKGQLESKKKNKSWAYKGLNHYYDETTIKYMKKPINVNNN